MEKKDVVYNHLKLACYCPVCNVLIEAEINVIGQGEPCLRSASIICQNAEIRVDWGKYDQLQYIHRLCSSEVIAQNVLPYVNTPEAIQPEILSEPLIISDLTGQPMSPIPGHHFLELSTAVLHYLPGEAYRSFARFFVNRITGGADV